MGSIEFAVFLCSVYSELFKEVFVNISDKVTLSSKLLVSDFCYLINNLLNIVWSKISCSKSTFNKTTFKLLTRVRKTAKSCIKSNIQTTCRCIDDCAPARFFREKESTVCKCRVIYECGLNIRVVYIHSALNKLSFKIFYSVIKLFPDKTKKNKGEHHVSLFKERA